MFKHYLKIALRYLLRNRGLTLINVLGLAIGVCVFVLIMHYVKNEMSFDKFISRQKTLARLEFVTPTSASGWTTSAMGPDLVQSVPGIKSSTRYKNSGTSYWEFDKVKYKVSRLVFVDSNFFELFDLEMIAGDPGTALSAPVKAVLTESQAKIFFGDEEAVGQFLVSSGGRDVEVTGVVKDPPNFHLSFVISSHFKHFNKVLLTEM